MRIIKTMFFVFFFTFSSYCQKVITEGGSCICEYGKKTNLEICYVLIPKGYSFKTRNNDNIIILSFKPVFDNGRFKYALVLGKDTVNMNKVNNIDCQNCIGTTYLSAGKTDMILRYMRFYKRP
jgi:hypothetical protein